MAIVWKYVRQLKTGRLEFRRAFPVWAKTYLKRHELIVSLETRSLADLGAAERYGAALAKYEHLLATAGKARTRSFDELDAPRIAWLVESYTASFLAADDAARLAGTADAECHDAADSGLRDVLEQGRTAEIQATFQEEALSLAARQGWLPDVSSKAFAHLCLELLRATVRANGLRMERDRGNPVPTPVVPEPPLQLRQLNALKKSRSFAALVHEEMDRPTFSGGASTKQSWNTALRYFREVLGDLEPENITRRKVSDFADLLALAPVKRAIKENERSWSLPKLVEAYQDREALRLSWKARAAILGALQAAWNKCQRSGRISDDLLNPFARPNLGKAPPPRKNDGLTRDLSCSIFALPVFVAGERPSGGRGEASYWLPLLLLTTGARPEELAQALVTDVRAGDGEDRWSLAITAVGQHPHKGARSLKTPSAERTVPLAPVLIGLGFLDYVEWLRARGELALFPSLRPKGERRELFASFGAWWSGYLRENGVALDGKRPAREFRPTWATIARECGVSREAQEYLMGHAPDANDMNARYGSRDPLRREMRKLSFDGWGLEKARRWEPPITRTTNVDYPTARTGREPAAAE